MSVETLNLSGSTDEKISARIEILKSEAKRQISGLLRSQEGEILGNVESELIPSCHSWLNSVANMIHQLAPEKNPLVDECNRLMQSELMRSRIYFDIVLKMAGLLDSLEQEWKWGLLGHMEFVYFAEAFDQFLDCAQGFHKGGKKFESSVLASAVLEDTIKKICKKNGVDSKGKSLEPLIDELVKQNIITPVKAKRIKGYSAVRNHADHAEWEEFDIDDVGNMIKGIRELIDNQL